MNKEDLTKQVSSPKKTQYSRKKQDRRKITFIQNKIMV